MITRTFSTILALACVLDAQAPVVFSAAQYPLDAGPRGVRLGDMNGDGRLDAVSVGGTLTAQAAVSIGVGDGSFRPSVATSISGRGPEALAVVDVDGDGNLDAVTANRDSRDLTVLLGDGLGGFSRANSVQLAGPALEVVAADLSGDNVAEIVVSISDPGRIVVLRRGFFGGLAVVGTFSTLSRAPGRVAVGDVNLDTVPDLVVAEGSSVSLLVGTGMAMFAAAVPVATSLSLSSVNLADLNRDGALDLVTTGRVAATGTTAFGIGVSLGNGVGTFGSEVLTTTDQFIRYACVRDIDLDGSLDIVAALAGSELGIAYGDGLGGFPRFAHYLASGSQWFVDVGDLNGDGLDDVVAAHRDYDRLGVHLANLPGEFGMELGDTDNAHLVLADFDRDGLVDMLVDESLQRGMVGGGFATPTTALVAVSPRFHEVGDFDHDGALDVVVATGSAQLELWLGDGTGRFLASAVVPSELSTIDIEVRDLDGDGNLDVVSAHSENPIVPPPTPVNRVGVWLGDGQGGLTHLRWFDVAIDLTGLALDDLNGNGIAEIITSHGFLTPLWTVRYDLGLGSTISGTLPNRSFEGIATADLNADGIRDLMIVAHEPFAPALSEGQVVVMLGTAAGGFSAPTEHDVHGRLSSIEVGDVDGDGHDDVLVANGGAEPWTAHAALLRGDGNGGLGLAQLFAAGRSTRLHDVDADGRLDVVSALRGGVVDRNRFVPAPSNVSFGIGTPGTGGTLGLAASHPARPATPEFGLLTTNTPIDSLGVCMLANRASLSGQALLGVRFHVDLLASALLVQIPTRSISEHATFVPLPLPAAAAGLVGTTLHLQTFFVDAAAMPTGVSPLGIVASRGLSVTIVP